MKVLKVICLIFLSSISIQLYAQNVQIHYDVRHNIDPEQNKKNYPSLSFEYFKTIDSLGSFLFKIQSDLNGDNSNVGQTFIQLSQTLKFWQPAIYLSLNYSGGLGIAPPSFGYYLTNAYGLGLSYPFQWKGAWFNMNLQYRYTAFKLPSHDVQLTLYVGKGFFNYKLFIAGSLVSWTENRDQGIEYTVGLDGKKIAFFGDPQVWFRVKNGLSVGSRVNLYYNLIEGKKGFKIYPTTGVQYKFQK